MTADQANSLTGIPLTSVGQLGTDGAIDVQVHLVAAGYPNSVLLACRSDSLGGYEVTVAPTGIVSIWRFDEAGDGIRTVFLAGAASSAMLPGLALNDVVLRCEGSRISVAVNGVEAVAAEDSTYTSGQYLIGVAPAGAGGTAEAHFASVTVVSTTPQPPAATPAPRP